VTRIARPVVVKNSVEIAATPEVAFDYCVDLGGSSVGFMFLKDRRAPFGCDPSADLRPGYDEQMCTRPDHAFLLLDSPCYVQDVLPALGLTPPLPEQPAWAFDAE
jgi:hypothetical protein